MEEESGTREKGRAASDATRLRGCSGPELEMCGKKETEEDGGKTGKKSLIMGKKHPMLSPAGYDTTANFKKQ